MLDDLFDKVMEYYHSVKMNTFVNIKNCTHGNKKYEIHFIPSTHTYDRADIITIYLTGTTKLQIFSSDFKINNVDYFSTYICGYDFNYVNLNNYEELVDPHFNHIPTDKLLNMTPEDEFKCILSSDIISTIINLHNEYSHQYPSLNNLRYNESYYNVIKTIL